MSSYKPGASSATRARRYWTSSSRKLHNERIVANASPLRKPGHTHGSVARLSHMTGVIHTPDSKGDASESRRMIALIDDDDDAADYNDTGSAEVVDSQTWEGRIHKNKWITDHERRAEKRDVVYNGARLAMKSSAMRPFYMHEVLNAHPDLRVVLQGALDDCISYETDKNGTSAVSLTPNSPIKRKPCVVDPVHIERRLQGNSVTVARREKTDSSVSAAASAEQELMKSLNSSHIGHAYKSFLSDNSTK